MDRIEIIYAHLVSMRNNLEKESSIEEKYIREYNLLLSKIWELWFETQSFLINESLLEREITSITPNIPGIQEWNTTYSDLRYIDSKDFFIKIDSLLIFFKIKSNDVKIWFNV